MPARDWDAAGRDRSELYRGARLAAALDWAATHTAELNATERDFLDESRAASESAQRRLRAVLAGVASLLVLAVIAGLVALEQRGTAREQAVAADAQRLGARALAEDDLDLGLLLARQGVALDDSVQTRGSLLAALLKSPAALGVLRGDGERMTNVVLSPDQRTLAAGNADNKVFLFDTRTRRLIRTLEPTPIQSWITEMAFTPDGSRLAIGHDVETYGNKVAVLDVRSGRVVQRIDPPADRVLSGLRYSDDGRTLDLIAARWEVEEGPPELVRYDARTRQAAARSRGRQRKGLSERDAHARRAPHDRGGHAGDHRARREDAACARELPRRWGERPRAQQRRPHGRDRARRLGAVARPADRSCAHGRGPARFFDHPGPLHAGRPNAGHHRRGRQDRALGRRRAPRAPARRSRGTPARSTPRGSRATAPRSTPPASTAPWSSGTSPATGASAGRSRRARAIPAGLSSRSAPTAA